MPKFLVVQTVIRYQVVESGHLEDAEQDAETLGQWINDEVYTDVKEVDE